MKLSQERCDVREALFGGRGEVRVWSVLAAGAEPFTAALWCELAPAGSVGPHVQEEFPELIIGVSGEGQASVNGEACELGPGDSVFLPLGAVLALENRSQSEPLRYLIVKARGR